VIVRTQPLDPRRMVGTTPGTVAMVNSSKATFALVETRTTRQIVKEIDDEGLLALLQGRPAALVRRGSNQAELVFLNPEDAKGFPLQ
jgi:Na+-transporting NADH:ubiquinone oxidoreductase subunit NqrA